MNRTTRRSCIAAVAVAMLVAPTACSSGSSAADKGSNAAAPGTASGTIVAPAKQLTFGYISPGPDTWYKRDVEGFQYAADKYGVKVVVLNSQYDQQKEIQNIQSLTGQGVDGISMFSFNQNGAMMAAQEGQKAGIPVVLTDDVGSAIGKGSKVAAAVDFDWCGMGQKYAQEMAQKWPGKNFAILAGNFEAPPTQVLDKCMLDEAKKLGKNENVYLQQTGYSPEKAVNLTQSLIASGKDFGILFVMDDDMGAAVAQVLQSQGLADKVHLMTQNGSEVGLKMLKDGTLAYTISSSPGWEGTVAFLHLYAAATGKLPADGSKQVELPVMPIDSSSNLDDKATVVPWAPDPVYWELNAKYFPEMVPANK